METDNRTWGYLPNTPRPLIGLMPRRFWDEYHNFFDLRDYIDRYYEVCEAIARYEAVGKPPMQDWILEKVELYARCRKEMRWATDPMNILRRF